MNSNIEIEVFPIKTPTARYGRVRIVGTSPITLSSELVIHISVSAHIALRALVVWFDAEKKINVYKSSAYPLDLARDISIEDLMQGLKEMGFIVSCEVINTTL